MAQYTDIYEIVAPNEAAAGEVVPISVYVKSLHSSVFTMVLVGVFGYDGAKTITFPVMYWNIEPGIAVCFEGSFTMPASSGTIHAITAWWNGTEYIRDDEMTKEVALAEPEEESEFDVSRSADYNVKEVTAGTPIECRFTITHRGPAEKVYVGIAIGKSGFFHASPDEIPPEGYIFSEMSFGDEVEGHHDVVVSGFFPSTAYYSAGTFDVLKFVTPSPPKPYIAPARFDDDWDDDVFEIKAVPAQSEFSVSSEAYYNVKEVTPGTPITCDFTVTHRGPAEKVYVGIAIGKSGFTHASPDEIPQEGYIFQEMEFGDDPVERQSSISIIGTFPSTAYYSSAGAFDILRYVTPSPPKPYIAPARFDDDWDDDVFEIKGGEFQNFAITGYDGALVGEQLLVEVGDTVRVNMTVDYRGPAIDGAIRTAIGWYVGIVIKQFLSTSIGRTSVHFDESDEFVTYEFDCDVVILALPLADELLYGTLLDMYAKIVEVPGPDISTPVYMGVIAWSKPIEEYELIQHTVSHFAYIYDGNEETTTVTLKTDPFKGADWLPEKFIAELEREARESGVRVLETKVYVDTGPLFWTDYRIEVTGTPSGEVTEEVGVGGLPAIPLFVKIILTALAIAFAIYIVSWAVKQFTGIFQHKVGLEDMKPAWGKDALILDIRDAEGHWGRTLTPEETLEGMSEAELRDILDQIAEEEVAPPEVSWLPLVAVGGLAVLGIGAAVALAPKRKE